MSQMVVNSILEHDVTSLVELWMLRLYIDSCGCSIIGKFIHP